jgi:hypothetical protein
MLYQTPFYPEMAINNTYDLELINQKTYEKAVQTWNTPKKGCHDLLVKCRTAAAKLDPEEYANNPDVNELCIAATQVCAQVTFLSQGTERSPFDIAHLLPDPSPPSYPVGFMNQAWIQEELGTRVNFTLSSPVVSASVIGTGDTFRREGMKDIEYLLDAGVKVSLIYGDRDMRCPWNGAESLSLKANWEGKEAYNAAGYEGIRTNKTYEGGVVKQYGNMSFARVFESGHDGKSHPRYSSLSPILSLTSSLTVSFYQPETVYRIFNRAIFNTDVATGKVPTSGSFNNYTSVGPLSSFGIKNVLPPSAPVDCNLWAVAPTCTMDQLYALGNGTAEINEGGKIVKPVGGGGPIAVNTGF